MYIVKTTEMVNYQRKEYMLYSTVHCSILERREGGRRDRSQGLRREDDIGWTEYLEESVYVSHPIVLGEGDLLNHLPGDGLEAGQGQQDLSKPEHDGMTT